MPKKNKQKVFKQIKAIQIIISKLLRQKENEKKMQLAITLIVHLLTIVSNPEEPIKLRMRFEEI